ncbi:MAG TPA: cupin domain-containing protein [Pseudolysinimonas sp.]|nr:cupin domain-containing protein [Pseudolysinimonas sp.]
MLLSLETLNAAGFSPMNADELPPFAAFLDGTTGVEQVHLAGPLGGAGQISGLKFATGGFAYTDMPISESAFLLEGSVVVNDGTTSYSVSAGEGFIIPLGFTGTVTAVTPVTKIFHVL